MITCNCIRCENRSVYCSILLKKERERLEIIRDGHIHTPFCPHGSKDTLKQYVERAIELGLETISFTEHAPLPKGFTDPVPQQDSALPYDQWKEYIHAIKKYQQAYQKDIRILVGFEVDYIEGFEQETTELLNEIGPFLDDSILSVHFLRVQDKYTCVDYQPESVKTLIEQTGSLEQVIDLYFDTVLRSITADLGPYKPKRIGHMTLIRKFHRLYPNMSVEQVFQRSLDVLDAVKEEQLELDYNGAGTKKPHCQETYPPPSIVKEAKKRGIPLVYGSDAHAVKGLLQGKEQLIF